MIRACRADGIQAIAVPLLLACPPVRLAIFVIQNCLRSKEFSGMLCNSFVPQAILPPDQSIAGLSACFAPLPCVL
jgi:hypothetical protein